MREYYEKSEGNHSFKAKPIEVTTWVDTSGYRWVRVDDFGMGLNEYIITNHLLKKGCSYYSSDYFKIQKRYFKEKTQKDFTPISRFGIGLLSCFILGDTLEINSRAKEIPQTKSQEEKVRLSIRSLQGQYFLQTEREKNKPLEMPDKIQNENQFRKEFGTSVAVRISRNRDFLKFEESLGKMIKYYITCSPVDIYFNANKMGVDFNKIVNNTLSVKRFFSFSDEEKVAIEKVIQTKITCKIGIEILPIDITALSNNPNLKGQIVFLCLKFDDLEIEKVPFKWEFDFSLRNYNDRHISFSRKYVNPKTGKEEKEETKIKLDKIFAGAFDNENFNALFLHDHFDQYYSNKLKIIHNGINVPNSSDRFARDLTPKIAFRSDLFGPQSFPGGYRKNHGCFGIIYFQDNLIPELSVSRNTIKELSFSIYSNLFFATKEINNYKLNHKYYFNYLELVDENFLLKDIKADELVISGKWDDEKLIESEFGTLSINELKKKLKQGEIKIKLGKAFRFLEALYRGLIEINFEIEYINDDSNSSFFLIKALKNKKEILSEISNYYPLLFVSFNNDHILSHGNFINKKHWLGEWIFSNKEQLSLEFEIYFLILIRYITEGNIMEVNLILEYLKKTFVPNTLPANNIITKTDFHSHECPF